MQVKAFEEPAQVWRQAIAVQFEHPARLFRALTAKTDALEGWRRIDKVRLRASRQFGKELLGGPFPRLGERAAHPAPRQGHRENSLF